MPNKVKNIWDMAGNVSEWTMEAYGMTYRIPRGGGYYGSGSIDPVSLRDSLHGPTNTSNSIGFRVALYL